MMNSIRRQLEAALAAIGYMSFGRPSTTWRIGRVRVNMFYKKRRKGDLSYAAREIVVYRDAEDGKVVVESPMPPNTLGWIGHIATSRWAKCSADCIEEIKPGDAIWTDTADADIEGDAREPATLADYREVLEPITIDDENA